MPRWLEARALLVAAFKTTADVEGVAGALEAFRDVFEVVKEEARRARHPKPT